MPKKLSVVISGAVSLGSYEAGVMYEVLEAIARHNENTTEDNHIEIDVLTGASAGGMTASILAQKLLFDDGSLRHPYDNALYKAWVEKVDIVPLLDVAPSEQKESLLQKTVVENIAKELLLDNAQLLEKIKGKDSRGESLLKKHPAASSTIQIGVAMSNLSGFKYAIQTSEENKFEYTRFKDQFICNVSRNDNGFVLQEKQLTFDNQWEPFREITWSDLKEAGISSGSFPLAFPLRPINREGGQGMFKPRNGDFFYTDGGVFENEPVGMAKALINPDNQEDRYYLLIKPGARTTGNNLPSGKQNLLKTALSLFGGVVQQAQFQDRIMKEIGENNLLYTITSNDNELVGEVLSAFSGFLEEKFRAYDYNIGRENARKQLVRASDAGLLSFDETQMPQIGWVVAPEKSVIGGGTLTQWKDVKPLLSTLADGTGKGQLGQLHQLMREVNPDTREKINRGLKERLGNLIDFINEEYLNANDQNFNEEMNQFLIKWLPENIPLLEVLNLKAKNRFLNIILGSGFVSNFLTQLRGKIGKPLFKAFSIFLLDIWLKKNITNPPH